MDFEQAFAEGTQGLEHISVGICPTCETCQSDFDEDDADIFAEKISEGKIFDEGGFSWSRCDTCNSRLGGNRYSAHAVNTETRETVHLAVCEACLCFIANDDIPKAWEP